MKITAVNTAVIAGNFEWTLVRVDTDEGLSGLGEAYWGAGVRDALARCGAMLIGEDPRDVDRLWTRMYRGLSGAGSIAGTVVSAISGIEIALWDLLGKSLGAPIYRLLGGKYRDRIRIYADCHCGESSEPASYAQRAREVKALGFTALKFDLDVPTPHQLDPYNRCLTNPEIRHMAAVAEALREALGPDCDLALDCHWRYNTRDAIRLAQRLEEYELLWLEDPVPPENLEAQARVTGATRTPICTGENLYTRHGLRRLIELQAADIIAPDLPKVGGIAETRRIAEMADMYYLPLALHNVASPIATLAAVHLCAAVPNFLALEFHAVDVPWWDDLVAGPPLIQHGYITVPDAPGLGVELNEELAQQHLRKGSAFFE